jgi:hypothetical protein
VIGACLDYLFGQVLGHRVHAQNPVTVHGLVVEFLRVHHEVVLEVVRVRQRVKEAPALVEGDLDLAAVSDARPGFSLLGEELDGYAVMRRDFGPAARSRDNPVVVAGREVEPGAVARVVLDTADQEGDPTEQGT